MFIYFSERGRCGGGQKKKSMWERNSNLLPPIHTPTKDQTHSLGMCPDWDLNPQPLGVQDDAPTNWASRLGLKAFKVSGNGFKCIQQMKEELFKKIY